MPRAGKRKKSKDYLLGDDDVTLAVCKGRNKGSEDGAEGGEDRRAYTCEENHIPGRVANTEMPAPGFASASLTSQCRTVICVSHGGAQGSRSRCLVSWDWKDFKVIQLNPALLIAETRWGAEMKPGGRPRGVRTDRADVKLTELYISGMVAYSDFRERRRDARKPVGDH